jgi:hypothetical protein
MPAMDNDLFHAWDAGQILDDIPEVSAVYRFNATLQSYEQYVRINGSQSGTDFDISVGEGYIFELTDAASWDPNGPGGLLASTAENTGKTTPAAIVVEPGGDGQPRVFARLANLSSSAISVAWSTGGAGAGKLVVTSLADGSRMEFLPVSIGINGEMSFAQVNGLKPEEQYTWKVEGAAEELSGSFTAAQVGIGMYPYSIYGRLVDGRGKPLGGLLVTLKVVGESGESDLLSATTGSEGYWTVNLGNLKTAATGEVFEYKAGDEVAIQVLGTDWSRSFTSHVGPDSPFNVALDLTGEDVASDGAAGKNPVGPSLPRAFSLAQNFPNPFNPSTTNKFALPQNTGAVAARLAVFNLRGQEVAVLVDRALQPGEYTVQWNGVDRFGRKVSSGVYFYRLTTPGFSATRKMVILK